MKNKSRIPGGEGLSKQSEIVVLVTIIFRMTECSVLSPNGCPVHHLALGVDEHR